MLAVIREKWDQALIVLVSIGIVASLGVLLWPAPQYQLVIEEGQPLTLRSEKSTPSVKAPASVASARLPKGKKILPPLSIAITQPVLKSWNSYRGLAR